MARTHFYAAPEDNEAFRNYVESLGLYVLPYRLNLFGRTGPRPKGEYGGYLSFLPAHELHPYKRPTEWFRRSISNISDPLIWWLASYLDQQCIVQGTLAWEFHEPGREEEEAKGKYYFGKLRRWIQQNWPMAKEYDRYCGRHAIQLIKYQAYRPTGLPPGIEVEYVEVGE